MADIEHKVIYRAVAKFGELYREIAEANAAVKTLRDEHNKNAKAANDEAKAVTKANQEIVASAKSANEAIERDTLKRERNVTEARERAHGQALKDYKRFLDERAKLDEAARKKSVEEAIKLQGTHPTQIAAAQKAAFEEEKRRNTEREKTAAAAAALQAKRDADHLKALAEANRRLEEQRRRILEAAEAQRVATRAQEIFEEGERKHQARRSAERADRPAPTPTRSGKDFTPEEIEREVKDVILRLQRERGEWVSILRLRDELGNKFSRDQVDNALRSIEQDQHHNIIPESNRRVLTDRDREAALRIGGQDKELVGSSQPDFAAAKAEAERRHREAQQPPRPVEPPPAVDEELRQQVARRRAETLAQQEVRNEGRAAELKLREQERAAEAARKLQEKADKDRAKAARDLETQEQRAAEAASRIQEKRDRDHAKALRDIAQAEARASEEKRKAQEKLFREEARNEAQAEARAAAQARKAQEKFERERVAPAYPHEGRVRESGLDYKAYNKAHPGSVEGGVAPGSAGSKALRDYSIGGFKGANRLLRDDESLFDEPDEVVDKAVRNVQKIKEVFEQAEGLQENLKVYRGFMVDASEALDLTPGALLHDPAFQSASMREGTAENFAGKGYGDRYADKQRLMMEFVAKKGTPAVTLPGEDSAEAEVLLRQGHYRVLGSKETEPGYHHVQVEQLTPEQYAAEQQKQKLGTDPKAVAAAHREALALEKQQTAEVARRAAIEEKRDRDHGRALKEFARFQDNQLRAQGAHPDQVATAERGAYKEEASRQIAAQRDVQREQDRITKETKRDKLAADRDVARERKKIAAAETDAYKEDRRRQIAADNDAARSRIALEKAQTQALAIERTRRRGKKNRSFAAAGRAIRNAARPNARTGNDDVDKGGRFDRLLAVGDALPLVGQNMTRFQTIVAAVTVLIIALVPVVVSLTAALLALSSAVVAGAVAVGAFAASAIGQIAALKKAIDDARKSGKPLAVEYQGVANSLYQLQDAYRDFLRITRVPVFAVFIDAMNLLTRLMPRFTPLVDKAAYALRGMIGQIDSATQSGTFGRFLEFAGRQGPAAIRDFTRILLTFGQGFAELLIAVEPFIAFFVQGFQRMATAFENWAAGLSQDQGFQSFMDYAVRVGPKVLQIFYDIVGALVHLAEGLAPVGLALLVVVQILSNFITLFPPGFFTTIVGGFIALWLALRVYVGLTVIIRLFRELRLIMIAFDVVTKLKVAFILLSQAVNTMVTAMGVAEGRAAGLRAALVALGGAGVIGLVVTAISAVIYLLSRLGAAHDEAAKKAKDHADRVNALAEALRQSGGEVTDDVRKTQISTLTQVGPVDIGYDHRQVQSSVARAAREAGVNSNDLVEGTLGDEQARKRVEEKLNQQILQGELDQNAAKTEDQYVAGKTKAATAQSALDEFKKEADAGRDAIDVSKDLADASIKTTDALRDEALMTGSLADKRKALTTDTEAQTNQQAAFDAYKDYKQDVQDLTDAMQAQKDTAVDVARANIDATRKVADATKAATRADRDSIRAQQDLVQARQDATDKIKEQQRVLRDLPLDEKEADLAVKRARRARGQAHGLDRQQANIDYQRAINTRNDLYEDAPEKIANATKIISDGVEGNRGVQDAEAALTDALDAQKTSAENLKRAIEDKDRTLRDGEKSNRDAAQRTQELKDKTTEARVELEKQALKLGISTDAVGLLKDKYQELIAQGMVNVDKVTGVDSLVEKANQAAIALEAMRLMAASPTLTIEAAFAQAKKNLAAANVTKVDDDKQGQSRNNGNNLATGGPVEGPGTATSDSIRANLSRGEHVWTAAEVIAVGGHTMVQAIREAALGRKVQSSRPTYEDRFTAELLKTAGVYGRGATSTFDASALYASLGQLGAPQGVSTPATVGAKVTTNNVRGAFTLGDVTINNPVREPSGASLYRTVRRLKNEHER